MEPCPDPSCDGILVYTEMAEQHRCTRCRLVQDVGYLAIPLDLRLQAAPLIEFNPKTQRYRFTGLSLREMLSEINSLGSRLKRRAAQKR